MDFSVQVTLSARGDAQEYAAFIRERGSPEAARRWLDGLQVALNGLRSAPLGYSIVPEAEELGAPYRSFIYHSHRVVYEVDEVVHRVTVHRVCHVARRPLRDEDLR